jgi:cysteine desulfurase / selenocysteine lyase
MNYPYYFLESSSLPTGLDPDSIKNEFPILQKPVRGKKLVYLDNAATSQKPHAVIDAIRKYYLDSNANVHRGVHWLSEKATTAYEMARIKMQNFINADHAEEIVFVRGATEAVNLVAQTFGRTAIGKGDEILITEMEHHSNIVPWQILCEQTGATLQVVHIDDNGELIQEEFQKNLSEKTRLVAITHVSNALGTINPIKEMIKTVHQAGARVLVDGAQAAPHLEVDVADLDCDFYVLSGHKMYAPTGIGILYGKKELLQDMPPYQGGGEMITRVSLSKSTYAKPPHRFEAGTPNIEGAIGLGAAVDYLNSLDLKAVSAYEDKLLQTATDFMSEIPGLKIIGTAPRKAGIISFVMDGIHPHDVGTILDQDGIAVRAGHHCAMPVMERFGLSATTRVSLALYNTLDDIHKLVEGLKQVQEVFK